MSSVAARGGRIGFADLQARLFKAVKAGNPAEARKLHARITPTAEVFYAEPWVDMHNRMKEALGIASQNGSATPPTLSREEVTAAIDRYEQQNGL